LRSPFIKRTPGTPPPGAPPVPESGVTSLPEAEGMEQEALRATALEAAAEATEARGAAGDVKPRNPRQAAILEGPVGKGVLTLAVPSVATMLLQTTNGMLDRFFIGHSTGPEGLAAVAVASSLMFALMSASMAISVGTTALVARSVGVDNYPQAVIATKQSLILAALISLAVGIPMFLLRRPLLVVMGMDAQALDLAAHYLSITIVGLPSLFLALILNGAFRGIGDTTRPLWVTLLANLVHAGFNYLLIFGAFGFPKMGLPGGALALVISQVLQVGLYTIFLKKSPLRDAMTGSWSLDSEWAKRIARIGLPASGQQLIRVGSMMAFQSLLARSGAGAAAVAALGIGLVSESIAFMPGFGYSIAASAFVGQNLGARQVQRANAGAWAATWQAVGVMSLMGIVFYTLAVPFAHLFLSQGEGSTADPAQVQRTIDLTVAYLKTAAWSEPFLAFGMVLTGALQGAGETKSPTFVTIATMVFLRLPLAWVMLNVLHLGTIGAWWAMSASTIVQGILIVILFRQGRWRNVQV
jgi:putative MATE family efflux protein